LTPELSSQDKFKAIRLDLIMEQVIAAVAGNYVDNVVDIIRLIKGPHRANEAKKLAMYLYQ
jgi:hypothetical protein